MYVLSFCLCFAHVHLYCGCEEYKSLKQQIGDMVLSQCTNASLTKPVWRCGCSRIRVHVHTATFGRRLLEALSAVFETAENTLQARSHGQSLS